MSEAPARDMIAGMRRDEVRPDVVREQPEESGEEFFEALEEERFLPEAEYFVRRGRWDRRPKPPGSS
jgi:hypothetical protein